MKANIKAKQGDRLDIIFFKFYSDLSLFNTFLRKNKDLLRKAILSGGEDIVLLNDYEAIPKENIKISPLLG